MGWGMRKSRLVRGYSLSEVLISLLVTMLVLTVVYQELVSIYVGQMTAADTAQTAADNRAAIDTMTDHVRNASSCNGSSGVNNSVLDSATATSFVYYSSVACAKVTYSLSGTNLMRTVGTGTPTIAARYVSALSFTYYAAATYNTPWATTANPHAPTAAELPQVCGILVDVTTTEDKVVSHMTTTVRLRNAPAKVNMSGL